MDDTFKFGFYTFLDDSKKAVDKMFKINLIFFGIIVILFIILFFKFNQKCDNKKNIIYKYVIHKPYTNNNLQHLENFNQESSNFNKKKNIIRLQNFMKIIYKIIIKVKKILFLKMINK